MHVKRFVGERVEIISKLNFVNGGISWVMMLQIVISCAWASSEFQGSCERWEVLLMIQKSRVKS